MSAGTIFVSGQHLVLNGITGNAGDVNGVASITVPVVVPTLALALTLSPLEVANALGLANLRVTGRPFSEMADGEFQVNFNFEGLAETDYTFDQAEAASTWEFDGSMSEDPIASHPRFFEILAEKYKWDFDLERFARDIEFKSDGTTALSKGNTKKRPTNPLYGAEGYNAIAGVYRRTMALTSVPASLWRGIGTIVKRPPGIEKIGVPSFRGRNFLKLCPQINIRGSAIMAGDGYLMSGPRGFNKDVYDFGQLD